MTVDPCPTCPLAECDDKAPGCPLRQAIRDYEWHQRRGIPASPELKARKAFAYQTLYPRAGQRERKRTTKPFRDSGYCRGHYFKLKKMGRL